jgi:hypothetical protein
MGFPLVGKVPSNQVERVRGHTGAGSDLVQVAERNVELADGTERTRDPAYLPARAAERVRARRLDQYRQHLAQAARSHASPVHRRDVARGGRRHRVEQRQQPLSQQPRG